MSTGKDRLGGNPYLGVLRSQLEKYIAEQYGSKHLAIKTTQTELRKIGKEISDLKKKLTAHEARKAALEGTMKARRRSHLIRWSYVHLRILTATSLAASGWSGLMRMLCSSGMITDGTFANSVVFP